MKKSMFMTIYIIPMILISPFIMTSSNSWFSIWFIMELNLMSFIPFIIFFNKFYKELSIKYFIIQAISSSFFIFFSNMMLINFYNFKLIFTLMINFSLLIKMGTPPFHNWFINMMNNMNWINCLILSTWQKIIPMISLMYMFNMYLIYLISVLSSFLSATFGLNHQSIRIIISYSSINHLSWMLMNLMISELTWLFYFSSYMIINLSIILILNKFNIMFINQFFSLKSNYKMNFFILFNFFSISGLPPMFGFSMKWISINYLNLNMIQPILIFMIIMSSLTFLFYMRIYTNLILNFKSTNKMILFNKFKNFDTFINLFFFISFFNLWSMSIWIY
uniref:NADH-ubiquinone oxidoreductase chain 2 n=1 Tax=Amblyjoppa sp. ZJUH_2016002 TaxID=2491150 RepID=A0A3S8V0A9_9HYME|nr:NADH dehydrogenase subunit 2 [Amblyjoppa sp. ZJUH_2016002]